MSRSKERIFEGACFAVLCIWSLVNSIQSGSISILSVAGVLGFLLAASACFFGVSVLAIIGFVLLIISSAPEMIGMFQSVIRGYISGGLLPVVAILFSALYIVYFAAMLLAAIRAKACRNMGVLASGLILLRFILNAILLGISMTSFAWHILLFTGALFFELSFNEAIEVKKVVTKANKARMENSVEHLLRLKALLNDGAITQAEFESEKNKILESRDTRE